VTIKLSKSRFIAERHCLKRLYLQVHEPELAAEPDAAADAIIEPGREVGLLAHRISGWGISRSFLITHFVSSSSNPHE
jgi:hypothetical protein